MLLTQFPTRFFSCDSKIVSSNKYFLIEVYMKNNLIDEIVTSLSPEVLQRFGHFSFYEIGCTNILRGLRSVWEKNGSLSICFFRRKILPDISSL